MKRLLKFLERVFRGEDVILVPQTKEQWEQQFVSGRWNRLREGQANTAEVARLVLDYASAKGERAHVLDVGCGNGGLARLIAHAVNYTGIDIAESAVFSAREAVPQGVFIVCDATHPPDNLGAFDILIFNELLYYIDPRTVLPRYRKHASSDARVYISVVHFWRSWFIWRRIKQKLQITERLAVKNSSHRWDIAVCTYI